MINMGERKKQGEDLRKKYIRIYSYALASKLDFFEIIVF